MKPINGITFAILLAYLRILYATDEPCSDCIPCPQGYISNDTNSLCSCCQESGSCQASDQCIPCNPGTYNEKFGSNVCKECSKGYFAQNYHTIKCTPCEPGEYQNEAGQASCLDCEPGSFCSSENCVSCTTCPPGTVQCERGQSFCELCGPGSMANTSGMTSCQVCPQGSVAENYGSTNCSECSPGWFAHSAIECLPCSPGSFCTHNGCTTCTGCPPGTELPAGNSSTANCQGCERGTYAPYVGTGKCITCPMGTYSLILNATLCEQCPARYYCPSPTIIQPCPVDSVCPPGSSEPYQCHGPVWSIQMATQECNLSGEFLAVVIGGAGSVLIILSVCALVIWKRVKQGNVSDIAISDLSDENIPIVPAVRRGNIKVMYTGL